MDELQKVDFFEMQLDRIASLYNTYLKVLKEPSTSSHLTPRILMGRVLAELNILYCFVVSSVLRTYVEGFDEQVEVVRTLLEYTGLAIRDKLKGRLEDS